MKEWFKSALTQVGLISSPSSAPAMKQLLMACEVGRKPEVWQRATRPLQTPHHVVVHVSAVQDPTM